MLRQGDAPRERLLHQFREDVDSVLFATASFWQGVDVRGESCSCVVIDRLPFASPADPLHEARSERIARDGGSPFDEYALPSAGLLLKQGFGRLVRADSDRGVVAVLDGRLRTAGYGATLLARAAAGAAGRDASRRSRRSSPRSPPPRCERGRSLRRYPGFHMSKRKLEATRANQARKTGDPSRRLPPGAKAPSKGPGGLPPWLMAVGGVLIVVVIARDRLLRAAR